MTSEQLERQTERNRADVAETLGELRERLTPGQIVDETLAYARDGGGEFLANFGRQFTDNPLPVTLIGAGLAWFLFANGKRGREPEHNPGSVHVAGADRAPGATNGGNNIASGVEYGKRAAHAVETGLGAAGDSLGAAAGSISDAASSASDTITSGVSRGSAAIADSATAAGQAATTATRDAIAFLKDQPLILAGAGIALGAAIGSILPGTDVEDRLMGKTSDDVKAQAKDFASDNLDDVKSAGQHLYSEVEKKTKEEIAGFAKAHGDASNKATFESGNGSGPGSQVSGAMNSASSH